MQRRSADVSEKGVLITAVIAMGSRSFGEVGKEYFEGSNERLSPPMVTWWFMVYACL